VTGINSPVTGFIHLLAGNDLELAIVVPLSDAPKLRLKDRHCEKFRIVLHNSMKFCGNRI